MSSDPGDDLLSQAVRALREEGQRPAPQARLTRERILAELRPARRSRRWVWAVPLAALLAGSTVLAATGRLPEVFSSAVRVLGLGSSGDAVRAPLPSKSRKSTQQPSDSPQDIRRAEPATVAPSATEPLPAAPPATAEVPAPAEAPAAATAEPPAMAPSTRRKTAPPAASAPAPAVDAAGSAASAASPLPAPSAVEPSSPEGPDTLALYRTAHRLHFVDQNPSAALAAWDAYLATDPHGPLAVDARYDRALCLVRLGRKAEARRALEPFAAGRYGGYRQADAKALLEALGSP